jgi:CubicO group peptidase (beta-lactamase class C family)
LPTKRSRTHTSGIADCFDDDGEDDYADLWATRPSYRLLRPADFLPLVGDLEPYAPPGKAWRYSNAGYVLLGLVIEELARRPYTAVMLAAHASSGEFTWGYGFLRYDEPRDRLHRPYP